MKQPFFAFEELVVDAWPALETSDLDGWLLRYSGGPTHRGNSVATLEAGYELELDERIARVEAFYRAHQQPAMFQIGPAVQPKELDATLAAYGYEISGAAQAMVAEPRALAISAVDGFDVQIAKKPQPGWSALALHQSRFAATSEALRGMLTRLGSRVHYVTAHEANVALATCYLIASEDRLGIYGMLTLPEARRRGLGRAMLHAIARLAVREQLRELYLLVERDNEGALALYAECGFRELYPYHYRKKMLSSV